jgi:O-antigen/teichoic acid export membrane protein
MISRLQLLQTVAIQGVGAVATMLTMAVVALRFGPAGQGYWAAYRSILDVVVVIGMYGFPQSFTYLINKQGVSPRRIARFARNYLLVLAPAVALCLILAFALRLVRLGGRIEVEIATIWLSSLPLVAHGVLRGIALATSHTRTFNLVGVLPAAAQLVVVSLWPNKDALTLPYAAVAASAVGFGLAYVLWVRNRVDYDSPGQSGLEIVELVRSGFWWLINVLMLSSLPAFIYQIELRRGVETADIGHFSLALMILGAALLPMSMVGPLIYNAWTKSETSQAMRTSYVDSGRWLVLGSLLITAGGIVVAPVFVPLFFGQGFARAIPYAQLLLLSVPLAYLSRLAANVLTSLGRPRSYASLLTLRWSVTVLPLLFTSSARLDVAAALYVVGELAACAVGVVMLKQLTGWSWSAILLVADSRLPGSAS